MKSFVEVKAIIDALNPEAREQFVKYMRHVASGGRLYMLEVKHDEGDRYMYPNAEGKRTTSTVRRGTFYAGLWHEPVDEIVNWSTDLVGNARGYDNDYVTRHLTSIHAWMEAFGSIAQNVVAKQFSEPQSMVNEWKERSKLYWDVTKSTDGGLDFNQYHMRKYLQCLSAPSVPNNARQAAAMGLPIDLF